MRNKREYKNSWIFVDKMNEAGDNAEYLYEYAMRFEKNIYFVVKRGGEWERLKGKGFNLIEWNSDEHLIAMMNCRYMIFSQDSLFDNSLLAFNKRVKFVFLQHGVIMSDMSKSMNLKKISLFITSTRMEYESVANNPSYNVGAREVRLTGLARHDRLLSLPKSEEYIFAFPTWRNGMKDLKSSDYYKGWMRLFHSLKDRRVVVMIHSFARKYKWEIPDHVEVVVGNIGELIAGCSIFITDYSSTSFEAAYIYKPVIYYQFDEREFRSRQYPQGYFDYRDHGFGPVAESESAVLEEIETIEKNSLDELYEKRMRETFQFRDGDCCKRIYSEILKLGGSVK